jgi:deoxyribodipyrimidine photo-lyase
MSTAVNDTVVMWFRRDLRLGDHPALSTAAAEHRRVVPLFVLDPALLARAGAVRVTYLRKALLSLEAATQGSLVVRLGDPRQVVPQVAREVGARRVIVTRDFTPRGRARDALVAGELSRADIAFRGIATPYAVEPGAVRKADGNPYAVFTPFRRAWTARGWEAPLPAPDVAWFGRPHLAGDDLTTMTDRVEPSLLPEADEVGVWQRWQRFAADGLDHYDQRRDLPGVDGTSGLSAALHFGLVHPRQLLAEVGDSAAHSVFTSELAWRDFYADVLLRAPDSAWNALDQRMAAMAVDTDARARERFARWAAGDTGYPIVDAGMRQLSATGWMHNRVRMIVASFLVKDLHLPWQWGARHFLDQLVDGDVASNNHGWQWAAGTGTDAAPYFRVFNPVTQGERYDPEGIYVRRWIPELEAVADRFVHAPWRAGGGVPSGYSPPMVDHAAERDEALARYRSLSGR